MLGLLGGKILTLKQFIQINKIRIIEEGGIKNLRVYVFQKAVLVSLLYILNVLKAEEILDAMKTFIGFNEVVNLRLFHIEYLIQWVPFVNVLYALRYFYSVGFLKVAHKRLDFW